LHTILSFLAVTALTLSGCAGIMNEARNGYAAQRAYEAGHAHYAASDYDVAIPLLTRAVALDPTFDDARAYLAWSHYRRGEYAQATREFRVGLQRQPSWAGLYDGLGWSRYRVGRHHLALDAFTQALALDPNYRDAQAGRAYSLFALERYAEARPQLERLLREGEGLGFQTPLEDVEDIRARYAWTLFYLGEYAAAEKQFAAGVAAHPDWAGLHNGLGWARLRRHDLASAVASFRRALELRPDLADAREGLELAAHARAGR
jgi:tetratricopeptide (TPR) repeat protein